METLVNILQLMDARMNRPGLYGWFHLLFMVLTVVVTILLCRFFKEGTARQTNRIVFIVAVIVALLEVYKQINFTFEVNDGVIASDYQWYAFPFQFCSMPMYVGLLVGVFRKGRVHDALCAFLATYSVFAGICVMLYPQDVFVSVIGINIQTMICHGSMIVVGVYLLYTGYVRLEHKTILKAMAVFASAVVLASVLNEIAHAVGLLETETFNMFFISPYCEPSLPVYSLVQKVVPYPWCLVIYILVFTVAAYLILLLSMLISKLSRATAKAV